MKRERGFSKKDNIDKMMEYAIHLRDRYSMSFAIVQQFNRGLSSTDRMDKNKLNEIEPNFGDFKESGDTTDGANVVFGMFSPLRHNLGNYRGYHISNKDAYIGLKDRFRSTKILKCRDGNADIIVSMGFIGEIGHFRELPTPNMLSVEDYKQISQIQKIVNYE